MQGRGGNGSSRRTSYISQFDGGGWSAATQRPGYCTVAIVMTIVLLVFALPTITLYGRASNNMQPSLISPAEVTGHPSDYRLLVIADLDTQSRVGTDGKVYHSILQEGTLHRSADTGRYSVQWGGAHKLKSGHNEAGRGMELSELVEYNGRLYTFDDRTGIVFEVIKESSGDYHVAPKHVLGEGDGSVDKGMKIEWATVKDGELVCGSFGKEYTNAAGAVISTNNNWVVLVDAEGRQRRYDWTQHYQTMREATGTTFPGYMIHEAGNWAPALRRWVFLPRRISPDPYDDAEDERKGSNKMLILDEALSKVEVREVGTIMPERGFSSFKFLPGTRDTVIVALKSEERSADNSQNTYITVFDLEGRVLLEETEMPGLAKFEGLEVWTA
ncbi:apyrase family protein [Tribonema minus]|uniref:Apyrase family protein n=1 Tax=Tribonema minus TaxID=303371 RepID=A0A835Z277_9STRA|nr:apyrase family protein [Tribonema minus]